MRQRNFPARLASSDDGRRAAVRERPVSAARGWTRRDLLRSAGGFGVGAAVATRGVRAGADSAFDVARSSRSRQGDDETTLTIATNRTPTDLDPHSAYDLGSIVVQKGPFEPLIGVVPGTADQYEPLIARSWTSNED